MQVISRGIPFRREVATVLKPSPRDLCHCQQLVCWHPCSSLDGIRDSKFLKCLDEEAFNRFVLNLPGTPPGVGLSQRFNRPFVLQLAQRPTRLHGDRRIVFIQTHNQRIH
jgi:hypothetical protein